MSDDTTTTDNESNAAAIIAAVRSTTEPKTLSVTPWGAAEEVIITTGANGVAALTPARKLFADIQPAPARRKGTIVVHDLASFVAIVNRDRRPDSVVFADTMKRELTAVLDFHGPGGSSPQWGEDRIKYGFTLSQQLTAWIRVEQGGPMDQKTFSRLIDDRIGDVGEGPFAADSLAGQFASRRGIQFASIADLLAFTRTIATKSTVESTEIVNEDTGDVSIQYAKRGDVKTPDGKPVPVPQAFALSIPVLNGEAADEYDIAVRLRYDISDKGIAWRVELNALDKYITKAIADAVEKLRAAPDAAVPGIAPLPILMGAAPAG